MANEANGMDEERRRGEDLVSRLARQKLELEAARRQAVAAAPESAPAPPPAPAARDGRPAPLRPPAEAQAEAPRRTPLSPPGNPPRTRTPFKTASGAAPEAQPPQAAAPQTPAPERRPPAPDSYAGFDFEALERRRAAAAPPPPASSGHPFAEAIAPESRPPRPGSPDRLAAGGVWTRAAPPAEPSPRGGFGGEEPDPFRQPSPPESSALRASEQHPQPETPPKTPFPPEFSEEPEEAPPEPEPFALERRRLRVPQPETPPVFPEDEEEEADEALDLTNRVPMTESARTRPFSAFEWGVASRYLRARRKDGFISAISWLSLVGIALGVAALIVVMAVMTGFRHEMVNQIMGVNAHATIAPQMTDVRRPFTNYDSMAARIAAEPGVVQAAPVIHGQALGSHGSASSIVLVRGVRLEDFRRMKAVADPETREGSLENFREDQGVALGSRLAFMLGLRVGDRITLMTHEGDMTPFGTIPRTKSYSVTYVFKLGMSEMDSALLYMPLEEAQIFFNKDGVVDGLEIMVQDPQNVDQMEPRLYRAAGEPVTIFTWSNSNSGYIGALDMERRVMRLILSLIILIAAFNIISGLIMLVKEKGRDVAILRTIGASRGAIMRIFFICGAAIGVIGTLMGVLLGVIIALNISPIQRFVEYVTGGTVFPDGIYFLSQIPSRLQWGDVATTAMIALGVSFLATLIPARRAARLDPVEALRYE